MCILNKSKFFSAVLVASLWIFSGCDTFTPGKQISKTSMVRIFLETDDLLSTPGVVADSGPQGIARRIEKYIVQDLKEHGIRTAPSNPAPSEDATLTLTLNTIETVTATSPGFWAPIVRQQPKIKYAATFTSGDGGKLFSFDDQQDDESLDTLAKKIADKVAGRVVKCYK
jgi:hypothetical protein